MATTAQPAILAPYLYGDEVVSVSASGLAVITRGDWLAFSSQVAANVPNGALASPAFKVSAAGLALSNNPAYDPLGRAINNTGLLAITRFVARVTASGSATARTFTKGIHAYPSTTGSGVVGQTGATGVGPLWVTAPPQGISANPTGAIASGVAQVLDHPVGGDVGIGQIDIRVNLATNVGYF